ncbi:hypothetical protein Q361_11914 [Flavobacterium croceum DSM 17960]|uniref:Uncharacterized protein n=1 Tax=Flavobacterium croceum DSM 17960 TaxID=1121886 RepID=A0A2S4N5A6_9FLAO|nr:hypothetical protein Q361_11914 [Flavobacterium croceum DSM 17960]
MSLHKQTSLNRKVILYVNPKKTNYTYMKSPLTTSLRKQTPMIKKAIPYVTAKKQNLNI